jgi:hypothetical protein
MRPTIRPDGMELCDCERPSPFHSGVPGVLAMMNDEGRLAEGAIVERCDVCERFRSDADAFQRLVELGLADSSGGSCAKAFTVRCIAVVRIEFPGVLAANAREAARQTLDRFDWDTHCRRAEFADEIAGLQVDSVHDGNRSQTATYDVGLNDVTEQSCPNCAWLFDNPGRRAPERNGDY